MLGVNAYPNEYIHDCRQLMDRMLAAKPKSGPQCESLVLTLDRMFVHRLRGVEGKDGNPANEVRVLCDAILEHGGVLHSDKQIKLDPSTSVLGLHVGDTITLTAKDVTRLAAAYFDEIEAKFT